MVVKLSEGKRSLKVKQAPQVSDFKSKYLYIMSQTLTFLTSHSKSQSCAVRLTLFEIDSPFHTLLQPSFKNRFTVFFYFLLRIHFSHRKDAAEFIYLVVLLQIQSGYTSAGQSRFSVSR